MSKTLAERLAEENAKIVAWKQLVQDVSDWLVEQKPENNDAATILVQQYYKDHNLDTINLLEMREVLFVFNKKKSNE